MKAFSRAVFEPVTSDLFVAGGVAMVLDRDGDGEFTGFRLQAGRIRNLLYVRSDCNAPADR